MWFNYLAETVTTPLSGDAIVPSEELSQRILTLPEKKSLYHCYYDLEKRDTFVGYQGLMRPVFNTIHIDLDSESDLGAEAWSDTIKLCTKLVAEKIQFNVFFSGNKGFHVAIPSASVGIHSGPKEEIEAKVQTLLEKLKPDYPTVDLRIWNANRKFRADGSMHEKTSLYKIRLTGRGLKLKDMSISAVRDLAKTRFTESYAHPRSDLPVNQWLASLIVDAKTKATRSMPSLKLIPAGSMIDDDSMQFSYFKGKKCTADMLNRLLPGFNRHDVSMRIIYDLYSTGTPEAECEKIMQTWATKIFGADTARATDTTRLVRDAYHKPQTYTYGCYDDVKKAYCSAKCKLFSNLNPEKRAQPIDMSEKQRSQASAVKRPEGEIADEIIATMGEVIICEGDFFEWVGTHWKRHDRAMVMKKITDCCIAALENKSFSAGVKSLRDHVLMKLPIAPEQNNLFACSGTKFPFLDGTVHVVKGPKGEIKLELREHSKEDYISHCKPFKFAGDHGLKTSGDFAHYVKTRRETMGDDGIVALKQLFGASLIPYAPRIFFLVGSSNTGKSTTAEILENLLGEDNVSSVNPTEDYRFAWESAIGKIANIKRELSLKKPLKDDLLKEIRDKRPVGVERKGIKGVKATLPFLHVYCCNTMPPSHEGNTGAWDNRITVMNFKAGYVNGFAHIDNLGAYIWEQDPGGILDFAREGLELLVKSGFKYTVTDESRESLEEWQEETDPVKAWLKAILSGEYEATIARKPETGSLVGSSLFDSFTTWAEKFNGSGFKFSDRRFFKELVRVGFVKVRKTNSGVAFQYEKLEKFVPTVTEHRHYGETRRDDSLSRIVDNAPF